MAHATASTVSEIRAPELFLGIRALVVSEPLRKLMETVEQVARTSAAVLITGESGSGKEMVARALHHFSPRCSKPWVDINCAALPEHLVESELFGYEKGAFSGAETAKPGLFELANSGTLFLDEIGELEPRIQVKLLRVLDGVPYYRLGGQRKTSTDVRIVTATNQSLEDLIATGQFRKDLYYRLSQIHLRVPPLRERRDDILPLAEYFLWEEKCKCGFSKSAADALVDYSWPGNVRELRNVVTKVAVLTQGEQIDLAMLPAEILESPSSQQEQEHVPVGRLEDIERKVILEVLSQTGWRHHKAAEMLGISRRTLTRKLKTYGVRNALDSVLA
jgi:transcriptional regulator with PAS, ATPase and Fis domain